MKILLSFLLASFHLICFSQQWFPVNATWYYHSIDGTYIRATVEKDTLINDSLSKRITFYTSTDAIISEEYLFESNDTVFRWDRLNSKYMKIYNFGAEIGDTMIWQTSPCYGSMRDNDTELPEIKSIVRKIDTIEVNGFKLPRYITEDYDEWGIGGVTIIKYIGVIENIFYNRGIVVTPEDGVPNNYDGFVTCYISPELKYGNNSLQTASSQKEETCSICITDTELIINTSSQNLNFAIISMKGEVVTKAQLNSSSVNINQLPKGSYAIIVSSIDLKSQSKFLFVK